MTHWRGARPYASERRLGCRPSSGVCLTGCLKIYSGVQDMSEQGPRTLSMLLWWLWEGRGNREEGSRQLGTDSHRLSPPVREKPLVLFK